jgi:hypothetical protein
MTTFFVRNWPDVREVPTTRTTLTASCWARNLDGSASIRPICLTPPSDFWVEWRDRLPLGAHLDEALTLVVHATEDDE